MPPKSSRLNSSQKNANTPGKGSTQNPETPKFLDKKTESDLQSIKNTFDTQLKKLKEQFDTQLAEAEKNFINSITNYLSRLNNLEQKATKLENENKTLLAKIDDMEQNQLNSSIILSGDNIVKQFKSIPGEIPKYEQPTWVASEILEKKCNLRKEDFLILSASRLGHKPDNTQEDKRPIILNVDNIKSKRNIISAIIKLKSKTLFVNECLTNRRRSLMKNLLEVKKTSDRKKEIKIYSRNGIIYAKYRNENARKILTQTDVQEFLSKLE